MLNGHWMVFGCVVVGGLYGDTLSKGGLILILP